MSKSSSCSRRASGAKRGDARSGGCGCGGRRSAGAGLTLDATGRWLLGARRLASPNCDARPPETTVDTLVIHGISFPPGEFGGGHVEDLFCNRLDPGVHSSFGDLAHLRVASHLLMRRDGKVVQFCAFDRRAWHAGESAFDGRESCNDFSIGIELEGLDHVPYEPVQYAQLITVARLLMRHYPAISPERIVGHSDIAPGRKTDPGPAFDWERLWSGLDPGARR